MEVVNLNYRNAFNVDHQQNGAKLDRDYVVSTLTIAFFYINYVSY